MPFASPTTAFAGSSGSAGAGLQRERRLRSAKRHEDHRAVQSAMASFFQIIDRWSSRRANQRSRQSRASAVTCRTGDVCTIIFSSNDAVVDLTPQNCGRDVNAPSFRTAAIRTIIFPALALLAAASFQPDFARAEEITLRVGHFPNVTYVQALVARDFERQNKSWFAPQLGPRRQDRVVCLQRRAERDGGGVSPAASTFSYIGPSPAINAYARSAVARRSAIVAGAVEGGAALVVQPGAALCFSARPTSAAHIVATPQFGNTQDVAEARSWLIEGGLQNHLDRWRCEGGADGKPRSARPCSRSRAESTRCGRSSPGSRGWEDGGGGPRAGGGDATRSLPC